MNIINVNVNYGGYNISNVFTFSYCLRYCIGTYYYITFLYLVIVVSFLVLE